MDAWSDVSAIIEEKSLLKHPFYQAWTAGTLTRGDLAHYARQYYQQESRFSRFLSAVHSKCDDLKARQMMIENLRHEEEGPANHAELWLRFAEEIGASKDSVKNAKINEETRSCVEAFASLAQDASWPAGLAALYAYEAQQPRVAVTKIAGLKSHYGVSSQKGLEFFKVHAEADVWHSESEKQILIEQVARDPKMKDGIAAAVSKACDALNGLLDGVCRERAIACSMERAAPVS